MKRLASKIFSLHYVWKIKYASYSSELKKGIEKCYIIFKTTIMRVNKNNSDTNLLSNNASNTFAHDMTLYKKWH